MQCFGCPSVCILLLAWSYVGLFGVGSIESRGLAHRQLRLHLWIIEPPQDAVVWLALLDSTSGLAPLGVGEVPSFAGIFNI